MPEDEAARPGTSHPRARASKELGLRFAELLAEEHSHQLGVCGRLGIPYSTYKTWMADSPESSPDVAEFRRVVLAAIDRQRVKDLQDAERAVDDAPGTHAATVWNMRKFRHESRFKRFYEPDAAKVELTGKDGGPVQLAGVPTDELLKLYLGTAPKADEDE